MMAIKNFLGHAVTTTERYAELSQSTVDQKIKEWNQRWFPENAAISEFVPGAVNNKMRLPGFLK